MCARCSLSESHAMVYSRAPDNSLVDAFSCFAHSVFLRFSHHSSFILIRPVDFSPSFHCKLHTHGFSAWKSDGDSPHTSRARFFCSGALSSSKLRILHSLSFPSISIFFFIFAVCIFHFSSFAVIPTGNFALFFLVLGFS